MQGYTDSSVRPQGNMQQIRCNERKKRWVWGLLVDYVRPLRELAHFCLYKHPHLVGQIIQLTEGKMRQWILWNHFPWSVSAFILVVRTLFVSSCAMGQLADVAWPDEKDIWGRGSPRPFWFRTWHVLDQHEGVKSDPYATIALRAIGC